MATEVTAETEASTATALAKAAEKVKRLVIKETSFLNLVQQNRLEALFVAWDIGDIIENEVIGAYGEGRVAEFANLCGFKTERTAYNYLYLKRAVWLKFLLNEHSDLPRTYWYALGSSIRWQDDVMGQSLRRSLLQRPLWRDINTGEEPDPDDPQRKRVVDSEKIQTVCKCLKTLRAELEADGILYAFEAYDYYVGKPPASDKEWEALLKDEDWLVSNRDPDKQPHREMLVHLYESVSGDGDERIDTFYVLSINQGDKDKFQKAQATIALAWDVIAQSIGEPQWITTDFSPEINAKVKANRLPPEVYKKGHAAVLYKLDKKRRVKEAQQQSGAAQLVEVGQKVICGKAEEVLKTAAFSKHMIDVCLTDPPYGSYSAWRETTDVDYDEPGSAEKAAELVSKVAEVLVKRELIKKQFIWLSFCPLDAVHIFLPPLLKVFEGLSVKHQVLVWDKEAAGPVKGHITFARHAEAILYVNVGDRALSSITVAGKAEELHPNIFNCRAESKADGDEYWKPVQLLEHLIRLTTGEEDDADANQQLILDPFCGKGSTGVASLNCHRDFRLIDSHQGQHAAAVENVTLAAVP